MGVPLAVLAVVGLAGRSAGLATPASLSAWAAAARPSPSRPAARAWPRMQARDTAAYAGPSTSPLLDSVMSPRDMKGMSIENLKQARHLHTRTPRPALRFYMLHPVITRHSFAPACLLCCSAAAQRPLRTLRTPLVQRPAGVPHCLPLPLPLCLLAFAALQ
jgi:hypothetical protein